MKLKISNLSIERDCLPPGQGELNSKGKPKRCNDEKVLGFHKKDLWTI